MELLPLQPYIIRALLGVFLISLNASIAGSFTVFRNVSFLVAGASHSALAGAALFILLGSMGMPEINPIVGGLIFALIVAISAGYTRKEDINTVIGISFAMSMSLAVLLISMIREYSSRVWTLLIGDIYLLTQHDIYLMVGVTAFNITLILMFYRAFLFISFDFEGAEAFGLNARLYNYVLLSIIALSSVILLKGVGAILVFAMLVAPAAASNEVARNIREVFLFSFLIALLSGLGGIAVSFFVNVSPGAFASLLATLTYFFILSLRRLSGKVQI